MSRIRIRFSFCFSVLGFLLSPSIFCQTYVSGEVNGIWSVENSPYIVTDHIHVTGTLQINAGVVVRFDPGTRMSVDHDDNWLIANGAPDQKILFTSNNDPAAPGDWNGFYFSWSENRVQLRHCIVEYATTGIYCTAIASGCDVENNYTRMDTCIIRYNSIHGIRCRGYGSSFSGCTWPKTGKCSPEIHACEIYENGKSGISLEAEEGYYSHGAIYAKIKHNVIRNNGENGMECLGDDPVNPKIINNTILENGNSGIVFADNFSKSSFQIVNNIISDNLVGVNSLLDSLPTCDYNNIWSNGTDYYGISPADHDISSDPLFVNAAAFDFHLSENSPCIDAGDPSIIDPDRTVSDIGAYFYSQPLDAEFTCSPTEGLVPLTVWCTDLSIGEISSWLWDFGDGETSDAQHPDHTYQEAGVYNVSLTLSGPGGSDTETKADYITVLVPAPEAAFTADPMSGEAPLEVSFEDQSTGNISNWFWDFGDDGSSDAQHPDHTYQEAGVYTVSLTVSGPGGSDTKTRTDCITVNEPAPEAAFTADPMSGEAPLEVSFEDQSTGTISNWFWDFGDDGSSDAQHPDHTYREAGVYTVSLTLSGPGGSDMETKADYISVEASANSSPEETCAGFGLYPNPTQHSITIQIQDAVPYRVELYSVSGLRLNAMDFEGPKASQLDLSSCQAGVYFIQIQLKDQVFTRKIIKE